MRDLHGRLVTQESKWPQMGELLRKVFNDPDPNENVIRLQDDICGPMFWPAIVDLERRLDKLEGSRARA
jgi:hypothetical protein